jgi:protoporphyrinogen oxidase
MKPCVVVGSGPAGVLSALMLSKKGREVYLLEEEATCGGLLRSFANKDGVVFDYGSHFLRQTGVKELDDLILGELDQEPERWQRLSHLKNGVIFRNQLYQYSCHVNVNALPKELYEKGILELMHLIPVSESQCRNEEEFLLRNFGPTFTEHVFRPALTKFTSLSLKELAPGARSLFDLGRIIAFSPEGARLIKKAPAFDNRIAYHFSDEGQAGLINYYPSTGGIGQWMERLVERCKEQGVKVRTSCRLENIVHKDRRISQLVLSNGEKIDCEMLIWSVAPPALLKCANLQFPLEAIKLRTVGLYYYVFDRPLLTEAQYVVSLDPEFKSFRISAYANFRSNPRDRSIHASCIEALLDKADESTAALENGVQELKKMKILDPEAKVLYQEAKSARAGFPVFTPQFLRQTQDLRSYLTETLSNLVLVGKGHGKTFFMNATLVDTFKTIHERL